LLGGNLVVERFAPFRFTRRHPELVGLTPVVGRIDDGIAVIVANLVGVGRFTRAQGVIVSHSHSVPLGGGRLNAIRTQILASECRDVTTDQSAR
jgi:hypothetical protein